MIFYGLTIVVTILLIVIYIKKTFYPTRREERILLTKKLRKLQLQSMQLQEILENHINFSNASGEILFDTTTCGDYLAEITKGHENFLSDYVAEKIKRGSSSYRSKVKQNLAMYSKKLRIAKKHIGKLQNQKSLAY